MAINVDDPTIPANCAAFPAPDVQFDDCAPELISGGFGFMILGNEPLDAAPLTATEYATRLALPLTDVKALREFVIEGDMPAPGERLTRYQGVDRPLPSDQVINVVVKEVNQKNYEFFRTTQGGRKTRAWFLTLDRKYLYGGKNGAGDDAAVLKLDPIVPSGEDDVHTGTGTLKWRGLYAPKRDLSLI